MAEDAPIEPYSQGRGIKSLHYPVVPLGKKCVGYQLPHDDAEALVTLLNEDRAVTHASYMMNYIIRSVTISIAIFIAILSWGDNNWYGMLCLILGIMLGMLWTEHAYNTKL